MNTNNTQHTIEFNRDSIQKYFGYNPAKSWRVMVLDHVTAEDSRTNLETSLLMVTNLNTSYIRKFFVIEKYKEYYTLYRSREVLALYKSDKLIKVLNKLIKYWVFI